MTPHLLILAALVAPSLALAQKAPPDVLAKITPTCVAAIKDRLKDPGSAKIEPSEFGALMPTGRWYLGVTVNAKNSYGGYSGAARWGCNVEQGTLRVASLTVSP